MSAGAGAAQAAGAAPANPYRLTSATAKGAPSRVVRAAVLTEEEERDKLVGYFVIPKDLWPFVKYGTHVRYVESAERGGEFRSGGFILNNPFDVKPKGAPAEKRFMKIQNSFTKNANYKTWLLAYEDVETLYAKGTGVELTLQGELKSVIAATNANLAALATYAKKLEGRIASLESP